MAKCSLPGFQELHEHAILPSMQHEHLSDNLDQLDLGDKVIFLVGTAHVSQESVTLAENVVREHKPDAIAVELCPSRERAIRDPDRWKNTDIVSVLRQGRQYVLLAQLVLSSFQKRLGLNLQSRPGAEMLRGLELAEELKVPVVLADRDIGITMRRTWGAVGFLTTLKLLSSLIDGVLNNKSFTKEEIERLKSTDALEAVLADMSKELPEIRRSLVTERDQYLAEKIRTAPGKTIVALVGAAHVPGILTAIQSSTDLKALESIPSPARWKRLVSWGVPALVIALFIFGFYRAGSDVSLEMVRLWFISHSIPAGVGALLAKAHPLTIVATIIAAPFTALHPLIGVGTVSGLVEAMVARPRVSDFDSIAEDLGHIKGIWTNRICRIFLIMFLTSIGGSLGTLIGLKWMTDLLH